ncbi:MAG: EF-P lysine aminoacylase EpmA [Alphaproteobacteria bacterium]
MSWWHPEEFIKKRKSLECKAEVLKAIRLFFEERSFIEVHTPALQICPVMDAHIHAFETELTGRGRIDSKSMYLHTSPEFDMKKLLAAGMERIYQICPVYRNSEVGRLHSPEFTLLEWYHTQRDYLFLMDQTTDLLRHIANSVGISGYTYQGEECDPFKEWNRISVSEAFRIYAQIDLEDCLDNVAEFKKQAKTINIRVCDDDQWDDVFHAIMAEKVEPFLGFDAPTILYDYPASMAALSRKKPNDARFAERFELYLCGIELANAFSELTDTQEQRARYHDEMALKERLYGVSYPADEEFFSALEIMPESAGIALGLDRLAMLVCGAEDIRDILWAPIQI